MRHAPSRPAALPSTAGTGKPEDAPRILACDVLTIPWAAHRLALECFRRRIEAGQPVVTNGDGSQRRDLTHVEDVARAVERARHCPGPGSVVSNVDTGRNHSVMDMLAAARKNAAPIVERQSPHPPDVPETLASISAVVAELGWEPRIFFSDESDL